MTRMAQLEQQVRELTNQIEQRDFQIRQLQQSFDKYVSDTNQRLQSLEQKLSGTITGTENEAAMDEPYSPPSPVPLQNESPAPNAPVQNAEPQSGGSVSGTLEDPNGVFHPTSTPQLGQIKEQSQEVQPPGVITSGRPQGGPAPTGPAQAYDQAFSYLQQGDYQDAERAFSEFLRAYPTHPLAANAQYWLGESYFAQTQYSTAAKTFAKAFQDHPQGQKAPDALLKLGLTLEKMNKKDDACLTLGELSKRFPSGPASVLRRGTEEAQRMGCPAQG
jgi:tol-pal system protein YbgF